MKQKLLLKSMLLLCALVAGSSSVWAGEESVIFSAQGYTNQQVIENYDGSNFSISFDKAEGSNSPAYYNTGTAVRVYAKNTFTISSTHTITAIALTFGTSDGSNTITTNVGTYSNGAWTGSANSVTFTIGGTSGNRRIAGVTVTYYTITAQSNNVEYGTVSLTDNLITGSPKSGYRYATPAYTVSSGTATVSQNGNAFTVTPTSDCTITINFEAIPTHTLSTLVSPAASGTVTLGSATVAEGLTTTATAAAEAGYKFTGWSIFGTGASLSSTTTNPTTVTMGTADATVTANFEAATTHAISYSVNGNVVKTENVEENADVDLSAPASGIPAGYVFKGWRTATLTETDIDPDDYVTSATSTADITYYAVMAVKTASAPDTYTKLASNSFDTNATYVIGGVQGGTGDGSTTMWYLNSYQAVDADVTWGVCTSNPSTYAPVTFKLSGEAGALVAKDNSGNYLTCISAKKFAMSSTSTTVYLHSDGTIRAASDGNYLRYNYNDGNGGLRWYAGNTTGQQAYFYKVIDNNVYKNFCTTLPTDPVSITPGKKYTTLTSVYPLDFSGVAELKAYIVTDDDTSDKYITLTQVNKVPANTGLVLGASSTDSPIEVPVLAGAADDVTGNLMAGSATETTAIAANDGYILKDGAFHPANAGNLPAGKAYLNIAVPAGAPVLNLNFGGETTGINAVNGSEFKVNGEYYNLAGQRVANPTKGLYIVNGKKVIIK